MADATPTPPGPPPAPTPEKVVEKIEQKLEGKGELPLTTKERADLLAEVRAGFKGISDLLQQVLQERAKTETAKLPTPPATPETKSETTQQQRKKERTGWGQREVE